MHFLDVGRVEVLPRDVIFVLDLDLIQYGELLRLGPTSEPVGSEFHKLSGEDENCVEAPAVPADEEQPAVDP